MIFCAALKKGKNIAIIYGTNLISIKVQKNLKDVIIDTVID